MQSQKVHRSHYESSDFNFTLSFTKTSSLQRGLRSYTAFTDGQLVEAEAVCTACDLCS